MTIQWKKPVVTYKFYWLTSDEEKFVWKLIDKNITIKSESFLNKIYINKPNAEVIIDYKIQKNKKNRFEASFRFFYDGKSFIYKNKSAFKFIDDLVNHAFTHFTRHVAEKK